MKPPPEMTRERMPVWSALSQFFLDTELQDEDYHHISKILARSPYSESELWEILRFEIYPACRANLLCVAGEWIAFGEEWIMERVAPRCGMRPKFRWPVLHGWIFRTHWNKVRKLVAELREGREVSQAPAA